MSLPRLLETRPTAHQVLLMTVPALIFGIVVGIALDLSAGFYLVLLLIASLGGVAAGLEHRKAAEGAQRGLVGGLLFGLGLIAGHHLLSQKAKASLAHPEALQAIVTAVAGALLGAIGGALRSRAERRARAGESGAAGEAGHERARSEPS